MSTEPGDGPSTVELRFTYEARELALMFRTRLRELRRRRRMAVWGGPMPFGLLAGLAFLLVQVARGEDGLPWPASVGGAILVGGGVAFLIGFTQARAYAKAAASSGELHIVVGPGELRSSNALGTTEHNLAAFGQPVELPEGILLMSNDEQARHLIYLPRRGLLDPDQADRLRSLLAAGTSAG